MIREVTLYIEGLDCEDEAKIIRAKLEGLKGITSFEISIMYRSVKAAYDETVIMQQEIIRAVAETGLEVLAPTASIIQTSSYGCPRAFI